MPLELPNLDDRTYAQLVEEARARIPVLAPEWTDHNPSDPGITLVELFAFVVESLLYRTNQVTNAEHRIFLQLINGSGWRPSDDLQADIRATVLGLRERFRAVTAEDYEQLLLTAWPASDAARRLGADGRIVRAQAFPRRDMTRGTPEGRAADAPGHISLVIVPDRPGDPSPAPSSDLLREAATWLEERRLLGTTHHVVPPGYVEVSVTAALAVADGAQGELVVQRAVDALRRHFQPAPSPDAPGWPLGRDVYISEIFQVLDKVPGVDYVADVSVGVADESRWLGEPAQRVGVRLRQYELVLLRLQPSDITVAKESA